MSHMPSHLFWLTSLFWVNCCFLYLKADISGCAMDCILCSSNSYANAGSPKSAAFRDRASGKGMKVTWVLRVRLSSDRVGGLTERGSEARALCACAEERPRGATASRRPSECKPEREAWPDTDPSNALVCTSSPRMASCEFLWSKPPGPWDLVMATWTDLQNAWRPGKQGDSCFKKQMKTGSR